MIFILIQFLIFQIHSQNWYRITTPHFEIYNEGKWQIQSLQMEVEKIYSLLKMNLSSFSPWMTKEKTKIYIFKDYDSYIKSEFKPPEWSKGLCFHKKRTIVVYYRKDIEDLSTTLIHELTHLYFEDFFIRKMKGPPVWLNEGFAVYMESLYKSDKSPWNISLFSFPPDKIVKFNTFTKIDVNQLKSDDEIAFWYLQSFGMVKYLYTVFGKPAFYKFNIELANNTDIEKALWNIYRISDWEIFEKRWFDWLSKIKNNKDFNFKPFKTIDFKSFN